MSGQRERERERERANVLEGVEYSCPILLELWRNHCGISWGKAGGKTEMSVL